MDKRHVIDRRKVRLEELMKDGYIPYMAGRPRREKAINTDDLTNLAIALNTSDSINDLLKKI